MFIYAVSDTGGKEENIGVHTPNGLGSCDAANAILNIRNQSIPR